MAITFRCEHCDKEIKAPDNAGGRWGKCPGCGSKIYVPAAGTEEELRLAPVDSAEIAEQKRLLAETFRIEQEILREKDEVLEDSPERAVPVYELGDDELKRNIVNYLRLMAEADLEQSARLEPAIIHCGKRALKFIDEIALSEIPEPELADIPPHVLAGLVRALRAKIK
ncbi:MAG: hypothetical protein WC476_00270 [Phycisphaerae bacterium]|jgi:DNA-directed RNA polymerase subunit RPC12/RpoP